MKTSVVASLGSVCLMALAVPFQANAQTAPVSPPANPPTDAEDADMGIGNNEIIVTARRRDEAIQDVPAVVNAVTSEDISRLNLRDFSEIAQIVPGLSLSTTEQGVGGNAQLRGVNFDINASGFNPTVEFYFNDAPITAGLILQQIYDISQIEVLRGPQGTLRGRASPSGSITVTSQRPDLYRIGGYVDLTANDIGSMNAQGALNIPIFAGIAAIRIAGVVNQDNGGNIRPLTRTVEGRDPYTNTTSYRASGTIAPAEWLRFEGTYQHLDRYARTFTQVQSSSLNDPNAAASPVLIRPEDRLSDNGRPLVIRQRNDIYNGHASASLLGQQLIYQFQHYSFTVDSLNNTDRANIFPTADLNQGTITDAKATSHEVRLQNEERVLGVFDYVLGYFNNSTESPTNLSVPTAVALPAFLGGGLATVVRTPIAVRTSSDESAFFGNLTAHIGESSQISGGIRFIDLKDQNTTSVGGNVISATAQEASPIIYSASAQHSFNRDLMVYASTGTSYRPGINAVGDFSAIQSPLERSFQNLGPEKSTSYEVGVKSSFLDRRLRANITGYHQTFENFVYRAANGVYYVNNSAAFDNGALVITPQPGQFNFVAGVPVKVNGVEGELAFDVTSRFNIGLSASYSLGKIRNGTIPCTDINGDGQPDNPTIAPTLTQLQAATGADFISACTTNQRSSNLPPFSATMQAEYDQPLSAHTDGYIRGLLNFQGQSQVDPAYQFDNVRRYALFNLYAGLRGHDGMWELNFFAKNLFNDIRALTTGTGYSTPFQVLQPPTFQTTAGANATSTYSGITTTPQREFGVNFRFRFGSR